MASRAEQMIPQIDPALLPLPENQDLDLTDGPTIAHAQGRTATMKVAGARRDKGKAHAVEPVDIPTHAKTGKSRGSTAASRKRKHSDDEDEDDTSRRGRPRGVGNYTSEDNSALLDAIEAELPVGAKGYQAVHRHFTRWARRNNRPECTLKSLETKFKQVCFFLIMIVYVQWLTLISSWSRLKSLQEMLTVRLRSNVHI